MLRKLIAATAVALGLFGAVSATPAAAFPGFRGGYHPGFHAGFRPAFGGFRPGFGGFRPGFAPGFRPGFAPGFRPGFAPGFRPGFAGGYVPGLGWRRGNGWRGWGYGAGLAGVAAGLAIAPYAAYPAYGGGYYDDSYVDPCVLQRVWVWNGYRHVRRLVRVCD